MVSQEPGSPSGSDRYVHGREACVEALSQALGRGGCRGELLQGSHTRVGDLSPTAARPEGLELLRPRGSEGRGPNPGEACHLTLHRATENLYFRADVLEVKDRALLVAWPEGLWIYDQRVGQRQTLSPGAARVQIPLPWQDVPLSFPLSDHSPQGIAFVAPAGSCPFLPGTPLPEMVITGLGDGGLRQVSGEVRHVTPFPEGDGFKVGVKLQDGPEAATSSSGVWGPAGLLRRLWDGLRVALGAGPRLLPAPNPLESLRIRRRHLGEVHILVDETPGIAPDARPPGVILCPDLGQRKEALEPIVQRVLGLFLSRGLPLRIYRVDSPEDPQPGPQRHALSLDAWGDDIGEALTLAEAECEGAPVVLTVGLKGAALTQRLLGPLPPTLRAWIALGGEPRPEGLLLAWSGGVDVLASELPPEEVRVGGVGLSGESVRESLARFLARSKGRHGALLAPIPAAITWMVDPSDPRTDSGAIYEDVIGGEGGPREVRILPPGSLNLRSRASETLVDEVAHRIHQCLHRGVAPLPERVVADVSGRLARTARAPVIHARALIEPLHRAEHPLPSPLSLLALHPTLGGIHAERLLHVLQRLKGGGAIVGPAIGQLPILLETLGRGGHVRGRCVLLSEDTVALELAANALEARGIAVRRSLGAGDTSGILDLTLALRGDLPAAVALQGSGLVAPRDLDRLGSLEGDWRLWSLLRGRGLSPRELRTLRASLGRRGLAVARDLGQLASSLHLSGAAPRADDRLEMMSSVGLAALHPPVRRPPLGLSPGEHAEIFAPLLFPCLGGIQGTLLSLYQCLSPGGRLTLTALHPGLDGDRIGLELLEQVRRTPCVSPALRALEPRTLLEGARGAGQALMGLMAGVAQGDVFLHDPEGLEGALRLVGFREVEVSEEGDRGGPAVIVARGVR